MTSRATISGVPTDVDVCVVGGGQAGLVTGYHLHRHHRGREADDALSFVVLDERERPGGAWTDGWTSLRLFSPASYSSLAGWPMPAWDGDGNPSAAHVVDYLTAYERRYDLPVRRPVEVESVAPHPESDRLVVRSSEGAQWRARVVISATGTWRRPFWPRVPGMDVFTGAQLHTADYRDPEPFRDQRVLVVGGGNSAAQIAADLLPVAARTVWVAARPPRMLPDDVDGRVLFETATRAVKDRAEGRSNAGVADLGDIVAVPAVREARDRGGLRAVAMVDRLTARGAEWDEATGTRAEDLDAVVWCTGFRPALGHLAPMRLARRHGHPATRTPGDAPDDGSPRVVAGGDPRLLFVGYGDWCGAASATLIGVNRSARAAAAAAVALVSGPGRGV